MRWLFFCTLILGGLNSKIVADDLFPSVAEGFEIKLFARDPMVRNPCAITFDKNGRLTVGMGPQYRKPRPDTPGDAVYLLHDIDGDGKADKVTKFASGFNCIQGLLWGDNKLYVANAPDFTVVEDVNGDGQADLYTRLYSDLGNLEHGLHGLHWGPDGYLYMSKGNSKGLSQLPDRIAPKPFRDLWGVTVNGVSDFPAPQVFKASEYKKEFHDPNDDWGRQGGILRCLPDGSALEIFAAGMRNPWDIAYDNTFNWLGTDNDQTNGDKIFSPFYGAHFGWGHEWSSNWEGKNHLPSVPASGPLFEGSGTGVCWWSSPGLPDSFHNSFLICDWMTRNVMVYQPEWNGALMIPSSTPLTKLAWASSGRNMSQSSGESFDPVDIEVGPDNAIYISSWGREYGANIKNGKMENEGRIYRISHPTALKQSKELNPDLDIDQLNGYSTEELVLALEYEPLEIRLRLIQLELITRIKEKGVSILNEVGEPHHIKARTWIIHAIAQAAHHDYLANLLPSLLVPGGENATSSIIQIIRCMRKPDFEKYRTTLSFCLEKGHARIRHATLSQILKVRPDGWRDLVSKILEKETDRVVYYAAWRALGGISSDDDLAKLTRSPHQGVRRGALLALLEESRADETLVKSLETDEDPTVAALAKKWLNDQDPFVIKGPALAQATQPNKKPVSLRKELEIELTEVPGGYAWRAALVGERVYTDRNYSITHIPKGIKGAGLLQLSNENDRNRSFKFKAEFLRGRQIIVAHDKRIPEGSIPDWLKEFDVLPGEIKTEDTSFRLLSKSVQPGAFIFGSNSQDGREFTRAQGQYFVLVSEVTHTEFNKPTIQLVKSYLSQSDPKRGEKLFLESTARGCVKCHQMNGMGNAFAPDLSEINKRADIDFIIQSILEPDRDITEGFNQVALSMKDGNVYSGILLEQTGRHYTLALLSGDKLNIPISEVRNKETLKSSGMPSFLASLFTAQEVADIASFLMSQAKSSQKAESGNWNWDFADNRLDIYLGSQRIMTYFTEYGEMTRPAFANIYSTSGEKVTRTFPAHENSDHRFMHPGLGMSFGWLNGEDFWRMKSKVKHLMFVDKPHVEDGTFQFEVKNAYLKKDSQDIVCFELARFEMRQLAKGYSIDWHSRFYNDQAEIVFGDQEESGLAIRIADDLKVKNGSGRIINDSGGQNEKGTWGELFHWIEYSGTRNDKRIGMAIVPDTTNHRRSWSHSRDYGVLVANPFPKQAKSQKTPLKPTTIPSQIPFDLRYKVMIFETEPDTIFSPDWFSKVPGSR